MSGSRTLRVLSSCLLVCGSLSGAYAGAQGAAAGLTTTEASGGLKEALSRGVSTAVAETGKPGGFAGNPAIRIAMPEKLQTVEKAARAVGMGAQVDGFEASMNKAAEAAVPAAKPILMEALRSMTFTDARQIVTGDKTAGTEYFKRTTSGPISDAFRPIVDKAMEQTGVSEKLSSLMQSAPKLPFAKTPTFDVNAYVLGKTIDGLFYMMGQEETRIRTDPAAQVTPLLKSVFGRF